MFKLHSNVTPVPKLLLERGDTVGEGRALSLERLDLRVHRVELLELLCELPLQGLPGKGGLKLIPTAEPTREPDSGTAPISAPADPAADPAPAPAAG